MADIKELIEDVLTSQHPKLRERCFVDRIKAVFEDFFGAYDAARGERAVLADRRDKVDAKLSQLSSARRVPHHLLSAVRLDFLCPSDVPASISYFA